MTRDLISESDLHKCSIIIHLFICLTFHCITSRLYQSNLPVESPLKITSCLWDGVTHSGVWDVLRAPCLWIADCVQSWRLCDEDLWRVNMKSDYASIWRAGRDFCSQSTGDPRLTCNDDVLGFMGCTIYIQWRLRGPSTSELNVTHLQQVWFCITLCFMSVCYTT